MAKVQINYTVTFNADSGDVSPESLQDLLNASVGDDISFSVYEEFGETVEESYRVESV